MNYFEEFRVKSNEKIDLARIDAGFKDKELSSGEGREETAQQVERMRQLQYLMYAEGKRSLLICLQGRDAAGKDGTINHVLWAMNPQGCNVKGFKVPTAEEAAHDFLWRYHQAVPQKGQVTIFNRSHYEDILVVRVHNLVPKSVWSKRYKQINQFEKMLSDNGTHILKFYLHIDADEQLERFKARIDDPTKHWKISDSDYAERPFWDEYTKAFETMLEKCSTKEAPWFIIPSNHKWFRNLAISTIINQYLESLDMKFPEPKIDIGDIRRRYHEIIKWENGD